MEGDFLGDPFNVEEESSGKEDFPISLGRLVHIVDNNGGFEPIGRKLVFSYESPVNPGDFTTAGNKGMGVNDFHCV